MTGKFYQQALEELKSEKAEKGLWAKCFAEADGNELKAKAAYIKARASRLLETFENESGKTVEHASRAPKRPWRFLFIGMMYFCLFWFFCFSAWVVSVSDVFDGWNKRKIGEMVPLAREKLTTFDSETINQNFLKLKSSDRWLTIPEDQRGYLEEKFAEAYKLARVQEDREVQRQNDSDSKRRIFVIVFRFLSVALLFALISHVKTGLILSIFLLSIPFVGWAILFYLEYKQANWPPRN